MDQAEQLRLQLQQSYKKHAKTIAVISGKGGVGKSNVVLNLSLSLAKRSKKVLLIDSDIGMANIDLLLGKSSSYSIVDMLDDQLPYEEIVKVGPYHLSYMSGGTSLSKLVELEEETFRFFVRELEKMVSEHDYILFDMGAGINEITMKFLMAVDEIVVITTPEPTAIMDAYAAMKLVFAKMPEKRVNLVVNRCQKRSDGERAWKRMYEVARNFLQEEIHLLGYLPDDHHVQLSVMDQTPFFIKYPSSPITKAIESISDNILGEVEVEKGFVHRLKKIFLKG
ncbi:MinD/ParA family protein [Bacillus sp. FJAT-47783]|uniref:MinD/ParA family protein n=1 Tax=Bacillus sp. FJAT-47783 TaxID=2922712 RepID=UPI001FAD6FEF|nr:MinD/ParA family protein [Bacillus sp. FJAT-47783]